MVHQIWFLTYEGIVGIIAIHIGSGGRAPVLSVATHMSMSGVLTGHKRCSRGSTDGATGIGLSEAHALAGHTVKIGSFDTLLTIATKSTITHIVTHDEDDVGPTALSTSLSLRLSLRHRRTSCHWQEPHCRHHQLSIFCHSMYIFQVIIIKDTLALCYVISMI